VFKTNLSVTIVPYPDFVSSYSFIGIIMY
jgi:hypothetical protein